MSQWSSTIKWEHWWVRKVFCSHYILYLPIYKTRIFSLTIIWKMGVSYKCTHNSAGFVSVFSLKQNTVWWGLSYMQGHKTITWKMRGEGSQNCIQNSPCSVYVFSWKQSNVRWAILNAGSFYVWANIMCVDSPPPRQTATTTTDSMVFKLKKGVTINTTHYMQGHITFK